MLWDSDSSSPLLFWNTGSNHILLWGSLLSRSLLHCPYHLFLDINVFLDVFLDFHPQNSQTIPLPLLTPCAQGCFYHVQYLVWAPLHCIINLPDFCPLCSGPTTFWFTMLIDSKGLFWGYTVHCTGHCDADDKTPASQAWYAEFCYWNHIYQSNAQLLSLTQQ